MAKLELYYMSTCPFSKKVLNYIEENKIEDKIIFKDINLNDYDKETLEKVTGKVQVPCIFIDGKPMFESDGIINYLKENII
ncbi:glutaredoxin family protein [Miniphocaeibacter halophilus]|uniref:Glutaredoxin n=1 Tax=Miniphocaeibacter halophilus TaxID=2931922 RepID=A0AC61MSK7_9FIRM|nr:glutaredoxin [Miniphocaeibacter halophilus]QQK08462.1 glutaredoxin [Miniphocaeibacter halophilus]